jgi:hypothetical protein
MPNRNDLYPCGFDRGRAPIARPKPQEPPHDADLAWVGGLSCLTSAAAVMWLIIAYWPEIRALAVTVEGWAR